MKKTFSILFVLLILVSGMHLTMATHICGGEVAAVKWSFSHEKAGCGMESTNQSCSAIITTDCCHDQLDAFTIDSNYSPTSYQLTKINQLLLQVFYVPANLEFLFSKYSFPTYTNILPPGTSRTRAVYLADICVFLI